MSVRNGSLPNGATRQPRHEDPVKPVVCLALPTYDGKVGVGTAQAYELLPTKGAVDVVRARCNSSLLTKTFNALWCAALNARAAGVTHFAMIHADIHPSAHGWLDVMVGELVKHDADMIAAVSPLKNDFGLTSTAVAVDSCDPWLCRRLTMREVYELPETFGAADVGGPLLLNTGLFVCDLSRPWWDELEPDGRTLKLCFDFKNRIIRDPETGEFHAEAVSEDWLFSQELNRRGAKLMATRKVVLGHEGSKEYTTDRAWGTQLTDELFHKLHAKRCANANSVSAGLPDQGSNPPEVSEGPRGGRLGGERQPLHQPGRCGAGAGQGA